MEREEIINMLDAIKEEVKNSDSEKFESFFKLGEFNSKFVHFFRPGKSKIVVELKIRKIKING